MVFAQAVYAGQFLDGLEGWVRWHEVSGWVILALGCAQCLLALLPTLRRICPGLWFLFSSIAIVLCEALQIGVGYGRFPAVHIPLGVLIFGGLLVQVTTLFTKCSA
jgi:hypothetical protein